MLKTQGYIFCIAHLPLPKPPPSRLCPQPLLSLSSTDHGSTPCSSHRPGLSQHQHCLTLSSPGFLGPLGAPSTATPPSGTCSVPQQASPGSKTSNCWEASPTSQTPALPASLLGELICLRRCKYCWKPQALCRCQALITPGAPCAALLCSRAAGGLLSQMMQCPRSELSILTHLWGGAGRGGQGRGKGAEDMGGKDGREEERVTEKAQPRLQSAPSPSSSQEPCGD